MHLLKKHFFKVSTVLLLLISVVAIYVAAKSIKTENHIFLPYFSYSDLDEYGYQYVTIKGTLISTSEESIASPLNSNEFTCDNSTRECRLVQAELFAGNLLTVYTESFMIESWDDNFIIFKTDPSGSQCVTWTYRIDRVKKELIGVRAPVDNYNYEVCMGIGLEDFQIKLVDGWDVIEKLRGYKKD